MMIHQYSFLCSLFSYLGTLNILNFYLQVISELNGKNIEDVIAQGK